MAKPRTSTLAEIRVLSLASLVYATQDAEDITGQDLSKADDVVKALKELRSKLANGPSVMQTLHMSMFTTVGLARQLRIDEDYGTQNIYGIGSPTRPRMVPNNYSASVTADRLQLDTRNLSHYITSPEYWYSDDVQQHIGIDDMLLYTYMFVRSKENDSKHRYDIYALMPRTSSSTVSSGDTMIVHNVSMTGFKYSYESLYFDTSNLVEDYLTRTAVNRVRTSNAPGGAGGQQPEA